MAALQTFFETGIAAPMTGLISSQSFSVQHAFLARKIGIV
jgi:hypothetical protein